MTQPALVQTAGLAESVSEYVAAIAATFERTVKVVVPALREPRTVHPDRAFKTIALVVETVAGFSIGLVTGELVRTVRAWFGDDIGARVRAGAAPVGRALGVTSRRFLDDPEQRPLVDELGTRLLPRLRIAVGDVRGLAEHAARVMPEGRERTMAAIFQRATHGSLLDERLGAEIRNGWANACAVIEGEPVPAIEGSARSRALWQAWSRLAGAAAPRPAESYIVAI